MAEFNFADRYAQAGLAPGAAIIEARQTTVSRIVTTLTIKQKFDLVGLYYLHPNLDLIWLRDEFLKEDAAFSLVNNERECSILAATILGSKVSQGDPVAILALLTTSQCGKRAPKEAGWLLDDARAKLLDLAAAARQPSEIDAEIGLPSLLKLGEDLKLLPANDWPQLVGALAKIQGEIRVVATKATAAIKSLASALQYQREETEMLWWLFSQYSKTLGRRFASFSRGAAAIVAGVDLGELTTVSFLGPVAASAMLERVLHLAPTDTGKKSLGAYLNAINAEDRQKLEVYGAGHPPRIFPIMTAIKLARETPEGWEAGLKRLADVDAELEFEPLGLATQTYYESLLGQLM